MPKSEKVATQVVRLIGIGIALAGIIRMAFLADDYIGPIMAGGILWLAANVHLWVNE